MPQKLQIRRRATFPRFYLSVLYHMFNQLVPCFGASLSDVNDLNVLLTSKQLISFIQSFSKDKEKLFMILILLFLIFFPDFLVLETGIFNGGRSFSHAKSSGLIARTAG